MCEVTAIVLNVMLLRNPRFSDNSWQEKICLQMLTQFKYDFNCDSFLN